MVEGKQRLARLSPEERTVYLESKVAALEAALEKRSRELRLLQRHLSPDGLLLLTRLRQGFPPLPQEAFSPSLWTETTELTQAEVEETMKDLWRSLSVPGSETDG